MTRTWKYTYVCVCHGHGHGHTQYSLSMSMCMEIEKLRKILRNPRGWPFKIKGEEEYPESPDTREQ
jgi:hypothetical protein